MIFNYKVKTNVSEAEGQITADSKQEAEEQLKNMYRGELQVDFKGKKLKVEVEDVKLEQVA